MTSIAFTGDIAFSGYFKHHWQKDFLDPKITDFLQNSDHVVANVECPLTDSVVTSKMEIVHFSSPEAGSWFPKISADIWTLANNHVLDCGEAGMLDTIAAAQKNGAKTVGAGRNIDEAGVSPAVALGRQEICRKFPGGKDLRYAKDPGFYCSPMV